MSIFEDIFGEEGGSHTTASPASLEQITTTAQRAVDLKAQIDDLDKTLGELKREYSDMTQNTLPSQMASAGLSKFSLEDGTEIKVDDFVSGSIPKDPERKKAALDWLLDNGAEDIIKTDVGMQFGKSEFDKAQIVAAELKAQGLPVTIETGVHPMTLQAFARERIRGGEALDLTALGLYVGRVAKIKGVKA